MELLQRFGAALQQVRKMRGMTQEDFSTISSRTYISSLERGIKSPTITKIDEIAGEMGVHPVSLFALAYAPLDPQARMEFFTQLFEEVQSLCRIDDEIG